MDASISAGWYPDPWGTHDLRYWDGTTWTHHTSSPETLTIEAPDSADSVDLEEPYELPPSPLEPDPRRPTSLIVFVVAVVASAAIVAVLMLTLPRSDDDTDRRDTAAAASAECLGAAQSVSGDEFVATGPADLVPVFNACTTRDEWVAMAAEYPELAGDKPVAWALRQCRLVAELAPSPLCLALSESD